MDSVWYYEDHGRAKGPISERELISKVKKGELQLLDLIYKEGDGEWHPIEFFTELTELIGSVSARDQADWILLRNIEVDGKQKFEQMGPFTIDQVLELVDKGRATFSDYVWRTGFDNWVSLGKVDKFEKPLVSSVEVDLSLYKLPRHEMIEQKPVAPVKAYTKHRKETVQEEAPPPEAKGRDLAKPSWEMSGPVAEPEPYDGPFSAETKITIKKSVMPPPPKEAAAKEAVKEVGAKEVRAEPVKEVVKDLAKEKEAAKEAARNEAKAAAREKAEAKEAQEKELAQEKEWAREKAEAKEAASKKEAKDKEAKEKEKKKSPYEHTLTIEPSLIRNDKKVIPTVASAARSKKTFGDELTGDIPTATPEAVHKMEHRWSLVSQYVGYGFVAFGIFLFGSWGIHTYFPKVEKGSSSKIIPALTEEVLAPPVYLPPPAEDMPKEAIEAAKKAEEKKEIKKAELDKKDDAKNELAKKDLAKKDQDKKTEVSATPAPAPAKVEEDSDSELMVEFANMDFKEKSMFHQNERQFIFYTTNKAVGVANELPALYRKKGKNLEGWKSGYSAWQGSLRRITSGELKSTEKRLYPDLYNRFKKAMVSLDNRAKDFNAQLVSGRNPTKELTVSDIVAELRKINAKAKALDQ